MRCEITFFQKAPPALMCHPSTLLRSPVTEIFEDVISILSNEFGWVELIVSEEGREKRYNFDWVVNLKTEMKSRLDLP